MLIIMVDMLWMVVSISLGWLSISGEYFRLIIFDSLGESVLFPVTFKITRLNKLIGQLLHLIHNLVIYYRT